MSATGCSLVFRNLGRLDWDSACREQERTAGAIARGAGGDTVLFVEHEPVYTRGLRFRAENFRLPFDAAGSMYCGIPVRRAWRGGELTYHGPGQLVVYPILRLPRGGPCLHRLVAFYQEVIIAALAELGIGAFGRREAVGVWTVRGKIASIGVGLRRGVTRNGFAVNVAVDKRAFEPIVPCGREEPLANVVDFVDGMDRMDRVDGRGRRISIDVVRGLVEKHFIRLAETELPRIKERA
ncbi:MAG: lipoyl(octanoyl) transferase LipB [Candidatus Sumerlaeia bacterium]|nr:lipoyl(octanoyl) transferase LipB [Candidatus Sumerlaeia bacterium]